MSNKLRWKKLAGLLTEGYEDRWPSREDEEEELADLKSKAEPRLPRTVVVDDEEYIGGRRAPAWMRSDYDPKSDSYAFDLDYNPYKELDEQVDMVADMNAPVEPVISGLAPISSLEQQRDDVRDEIDDVKNWLAGYVSYLRAIHLWFHAAHHLTKGTGFAGDHEDLYGRIYTEVQDEIDGAIEKAVGVTNDELLACPLMITSNAVEIMEEAGCKVSDSAHNIAKAGLRLEKAYIKFVEEMFATLEEMDAMTLGLNDQLASSANTHETYVYLLQQRVKDSKKL